MTLPAKGTVGPHTVDPCSSVSHGHVWCGGVVFPPGLRTGDEYADVRGASTVAVTGSQPEGSCRGTVGATVASTERSRAL